MWTSRKDRRQVAFYSLFLSCKIQSSPLFFDIATKFYADRDTAYLEQAYPALHHVRVNECPKCSGSTGYNEKLGIDCWFMVNLPLNEGGYLFIYDSLVNNIRLNMRDLQYAMDVDAALGEMQRTENAVRGGLERGWLVPSDILGKRIELNTPHNAYSISVASILGYIMRDGCIIAHMDFLSSVFSLDRLDKVPPDSPVNTYAIMFDTAKRINKPINSRIYFVDRE